MAKISKDAVNKFFSERKLAVVLVRSGENSNPQIKKTFKLLKLTTTNSLGLYKNTPMNKGMIRKIKDYATFGEIDDETIAYILSKTDPVKVNKKGEEYISNIVRMHPPKGGFERKGIKKSFLVGGALGNREEKIKNLIFKML